jgi:hypothetical protein
MKITKDWSPGGAGDRVTLSMEVDHDILDNKGRVIGGVAWIVDHTKLKPPAGEQYELEINTLRGGRHYGPRRPSSFFEKLEDAKAEAVKRLTRQGKAFYKTYVENR